MKWLVSAAALLLVLSCCSCELRIDSVLPRRGSQNGGTKITIFGDGFSQENNFQLDPNAPPYITVTMMTDSNTYPCPVEKDSTHAQQIHCNTNAMKSGRYWVNVTVNGVYVPQDKHCRGGFKNYHCSFYVVWYSTPTINYLNVTTGLPKSTVQLRGRIYTDVYGSNAAASSNGLEVRFLRAYMGGMTCELLRPNTDELYGLWLDSETSHNGYMTCMITGTYVGAQNLSYILDSLFGRCLPDKKTYKIFASGSLAMYETYAEILGVTPSEGSLMGGTLITIHGHYFDQTDHPARVLVGGRPCPIVSLTDTKIVCITPENQNPETGVYPGSRGLSGERWNETRWKQLSDIPSFNENTTGYQRFWVESLPHVFEKEDELFSTRTRGFFVPPKTDDYVFYIHCDDRCELYMSNSTNPQFKEKVAFQTKYVNSILSTVYQRSRVMTLTAGVPIYLEYLQQEYWGLASFNMGMFALRSPYTETQSDDAENEIQQIVATYDVSDLKQEILFDSWTSSTAVKEQQKISVTSSCVAPFCGSTFFVLGYGRARTGPIPVTVSATDMEDALNSLWTIKPDTVQVTRQDRSQGADFTVTFNSVRGDFEPLSAKVFGADPVIAVSEITKGQSDMATFTLVWDGVPSEPIAYNADASEVEAALMAMMAGDCPEEILTTEGSTVKFFKDYEGDNSQFDSSTKGTPVKNSGFCGRWSLKNANMLFMESYLGASTTAYGAISIDKFPTLCFAYKGSLKNEIGMKFTYKDLQGKVSEKTEQFTTVFNNGPKWSYKCVDMAGFLQGAFIGSEHMVKEIHLSKDSSKADFYVDAVHIGKTPTTYQANGIPDNRRPPPFEGDGISFEELKVSKQTPEASQVLYVVEAIAVDCGYGFPMMEMGFMQETERTEDMASFNADEASVNITYVTRASPPLKGTFDIGFADGRAQDVPVDISAENMKYTLEGIEQMGEVTVKWKGTCRKPLWQVNWVTNPGKQPLLQINSTNVVGPNANVFAKLKRQGGMFLKAMSGDFFRTLEYKPQAEVIINKIPSKCSGDCGYVWSEEKTPHLTGISPSQGSNGLGTLLTVTGTGFINESAVIMVGESECVVEEIQDDAQICRLGRSSAGTWKVSINFPSLGYASHEGGEMFSFTYQLIVSSISPTSGSLAGGTMLTVEGFGFSENTTVTVGTGECVIVDSSDLKLKCRTPEGDAGSKTVRVTVGSMTEVASSSFTYDAAKTSHIISLSPQTATLVGEQVLTIEGTNLGAHGSGSGSGSGSGVLVGMKECVVSQWTTTKISCVLPVLPPGEHQVDVQVGNNGFPVVRDGMNVTVKYVFEVSGVSPPVGSLYGGTTLTITGSGFSSNITDMKVSVGGVECEVTAASEEELQCVTKPDWKSVLVTNQGSHREYGPGYAWQPSSLSLLPGDTVEWHWQAVGLMSSEYRVFSVPQASGTTYDNAAFSSGDAGTTQGKYRYQFTVPKVYFVSSGYVDKAKARKLQGVINVRPAEDKHLPVTVSLHGMAAEHRPRGSTGVTASGCIVSAQCQQPEAPSGSINFNMLSCASPVVHSISPNQGTYHQVIHISGNHFTNTDCAMEVTVGDEPCQVINSTNTDIFCQLSANNGLPVAVAFPVGVRVNNLGSAIIAVPKELQRRFALLPVIDSISPAVGSSTGHTRVTVHGSGFSEGRVTVASEPCTVVNVTYTEIVCDTVPSLPKAGSTKFQAGSIAASCQSDCSFTYSSSVTPTLTGVTPSRITEPTTTITISGSGFGEDEGGVAVLVNSEELQVFTVTDDEITAQVTDLPAGTQQVVVIVRSKGMASGDGSIDIVAEAELTPEAGSTEGGTRLVITGNGFVPGKTAVTIDGEPCEIQDITPSKVNCRTPPHAEGSAEVDIEVLSVTFPTLTFNYSADYTPVVDFVTPTNGSSGTVITLSGSGFGSDQELVSVRMNDVDCSVISVSDDEIACTAGENGGGTYQIVVDHHVKGYAESEVEFRYGLTLGNVRPDEGSYAGGALVSIQGSGFDPHNSTVKVCGKACEVFREESTSTLIYCRTPAINDSAPELSCDVTVETALDTVSIPNGYTYRAELTPVIAEVSPRRGGTAGGTTLTITGSGFSTDMADVNVTIAGSVCDVQSTNATHITCVTNAQPRSQETQVLVSLRGQGHAKQESADFFYVDVWSSRFTWGGLSPPEKGSFVVITEGQTILLDVSTPVLKMLLIQGGTLVFDETDLELQAENILIVGGGHLVVGTEEQPFQHQATITLHGALRAPELPIYGAKTLGVREGTLDLHGIPVPQTWTRLAATAAEGASTITLEKKVTWKAGNKIVIATTGHRHSQKENEVRTIASVSADGLTLTLTEPLTYEHLGVKVTLPDGTVFEAQGEVGLLTRNVKFQGSINDEWSDTIEACPEGFDTGEFATQTCFQGRFGEEVGSDQFGACIMFHAQRPSENLAVGRIEHVEIFNAGQAFRLGRYPIHFHLVGNNDYKSFVRGCAIWQTYNRAVTIHNTHRLLVEHNVVYNIMGGAIFIEDGIETENIIQYNLAVFVKQSTSLLNDDVTPAAYWVTNPNNIIRHNHAAGGTHFGFWYRMHLHPDGPSYTPNICQKKVPLGEFNNNTVHSQGWFGLWIFQDFFPMKGGSCRSSIPEPALFNSLTTWNCEKGAEWVNVGAVQFHNFSMVNNEKVGIDTKRIFKQYVSGVGIEHGGALIKDSLIVGHVDELGGADCTLRGILAPFDDGMSVYDTKFVNFDRGACAALGVTSVGGVCLELCGGWPSRYSGLEFYNSPQKAGFRWEHEAVFVDVDGSLTGHVDHKVVPWNGLLDPAHCTRSAEWSVGIPGAACDNTVHFSRFASNNPTPTSLMGNNAIFSNEFGISTVPFAEKRLTHKLGWMAVLPMSQKLWLTFEDGDQFTNISYTGIFYGFKSDQYLIMNHNFTQSPDRFHIIDDRNGSSDPLTFNSNTNGDWYFDTDTNSLSYMISGKTSLQRRRRRSSVDRSMSDVSVNFKVFRCFYLDCIAPTPPPPATLAPIPTRRPADFVRWSDENFWKTSAANNFTAPTEDSDVVIPSGEWVVLDSSTPPLNKLTIIGVLEIPDTLDFSSSSRVARSAPEYTNFTIEAVYISIQGGRMIAGWDDEWFRGNLKIILRGDHNTPDWPLPNGPNQGSKVLGVFGQLQLYGQPQTVHRTKLSLTAEAGSSTLDLVEPVAWQAGDEVVISTSSYDVWETETRIITAVSADGHTVTVDQPLDFTHIGENHTIADTGVTYTLAADVGHLTRNIQIIGEEYPDMMEESFGARLLVGTYSWATIDYKGEAQIRYVEFRHSGQEGWSDSTDPRYSVAFLNLGTVTDDSSTLQGCSFHHGFSPAIGVFGTDHINIDDNVIHHTVGEGIRIWGAHVNVRRNLVTMTLWPGSYQNRRERFNFDWQAAVEAIEGRHVVLQHNIVAGYERVAYRINGEPCPGYHNDDEMWLNNEAHGGLYGVYMNADGLPGCTLIRDFFIWRSFDFGIFFQTRNNMIVSDVTLVDNGMGILPIIYGPPSLSHQYSDKSVEINRALIVGSSPNFNCTDTAPLDDYNLINSKDHRAPRPPQGGKSGLCWPTFASGHNRGPEMSLSGLLNYPAIKGLMTVNDTTFVGFKNVCSGQTDFMFMANPNNDDFQHPVQVSNLQLYDSEEEAKVFVQRAALDKINPSDCVDMECDAKKKSLLKDLDGSFLGEVGDVVPESEYAWEGDPRRGLGDYRIPAMMLTNPDGSRIPVEQIAPHKGVLREDCTYMPSWQSYKCVGLNYRILLIESLDSDTETRRLSPVAVLSGGFVDLINGPQDHGWCAGYTCQLRLSTFQSMVAIGREFEVFFSGTSPQKIRLMMLNADPSESVVMSIFMPTQQRLVVYVDNQLVPPTNALWNEDESDYTLAEGLEALYHPKMNASSGTNYFNADYKMLSVLVRGSGPVEIRTDPRLVIALDMPAMTVDEFFGEQLVNNLATFLKVPASMIRITNIIREDSRRRKRAAGMTVEMEIKKPPAQTTSNDTDDDEAFNELKNIGDSLGQAAVDGKLSESIGFNVSSMGIIPPPPAPSDPEWQTEAEKEPTREEEVVQRLAPVAALLMMQDPVGEYVGVLIQQPSVMAVDEEGNCVAVGVTQLTATATLRDSSGQSLDILEGNDTILFSGCWANYTNLAVTESGENMTMTFMLKEWSAHSRAFSAKSIPTTTLRPTAVSTSRPPSTGKESTEGGDTTAHDFTTTPRAITDDNSVFGTATTVLPGSLCLVSVIYSIACCSEEIPIC